MCHGGNPQAIHKETAHKGMEAYPGRMKTVNSTCGQSGCHADLVPLVENSIMNTLDGMLTVTRQVYEDEDPPHQNRTVAERLTNTGADSYLRKLCVSCHLGTERQNHSQSFRDRGGGCSACHLQTYVEKKVEKGVFDDPNITGVGKTHPSLTVKISNDRCFGCHARSGRISLNYLGLAEVETLDKSRPKDFGYLYDRRLVERKQADLHSEAGIACIDCHTANGLMGTGPRVPFLRDQADIKCNDCHARQVPTATIDQLNPRDRKYFSLYQGHTKTAPPDRIVLSQQKKSPLHHVYEKGQERYMVSKISGREMKIPFTSDAYYHEISGHERLTCDSCHTAWAPQCYGCHVEFKPEQQQFDHTQRKRTAGRWVETRWAVESDLPAMGVVNNDKITTFVPGMNLMVKKSPEAKTFEKRIYSATSAHTTQKVARSCKSCHQSDAALGIIKEWTTHSKIKEWRTPKGWIEENQKKPGVGTKPGDRSLNREEIARVRKAGQCLNCHQPDDKIYLNYPTALKNLTPSCKQ